MQTSLQPVRRAYSKVFGKSLIQKIACFFAAKPTESNDPYFVLLEHGKIVWAYTLKAYYPIYAPGPEKICWGMVVLSPHDDDTKAANFLKDVADWISSRRGIIDPSWSPELRQLMRDFDDDSPQEEPQSLSVPEEISPELNCLYTQCCFVRENLAAGRLAGGLIPVLYHPECAFCMPVPATCWTEEFTARWLMKIEERQSALAKPAVPPPLPADEAGEPVELCATNLPPRVLERLEALIEQEMERLSVPFEFLNAGYIKDQNRLAVDYSGDLSFIGPAGAVKAAFAVMQGVIAQHLTDEELGMIEFAKRIGEEEDFTPVDFVEGP